MQQLTTEAARPAWLNREEYPFASQLLELPSGRLHYVDEGQGSPILFVHGTPSSSYEYRRLIAGLRGEHRCVAPDHLGFGLSERPAGFSYSLADHTRNLQELVAATGLGRFSLVVHDFGGPIALPLALEQPERIERLVIMNSWLWPMDIDPKFKKSKPYLDTWLTKFLYLRANFSARYLVKAAWGQREPLSAERHQAFKAMFPNKQARLGTWAFARALATEDAYFMSLAERIPALRRIPTLVIWGSADSFVGEPHLTRWKAELPGARFVELPRVGHFPQDEAAEEVLALVRDFLSPSQPASLPHD